MTIFYFANIGEQNIDISWNEIWFNDFFVSTTS